MSEHKQGDFTGGLNRLEDASKIATNEYFFLSNARIRNGGLEPIKRPRKLVLGLPIDEAGPEDYIYTDAPSTPPIVTQPVVTPDWPPTPPQPPTWVFSPPAIFINTTWAPALVAPVTLPPPVPPAPPTVACGVNAKLWPWYNPWAPIGTAPGLIPFGKYPDAGISASNPNTALPAALIAWWEAKMLYDFIIWGIANNVNYSALGYKWEWDTSESGGNILSLYNSNLTEAYDAAGWTLKIAYCETAGAQAFYAKIRYHNTNAIGDTSCVDSVTSTVFTPITAVGVEAVVIVATQGPATGNVGPQQNLDLVTLNFDQDYRDFADGSDAPAYNITTTTRTYNAETLSCDIENTLTFTATHAELLAFIEVGSGSGTQNDPWIIELSDS